MRKYLHTQMGATNQQALLRWDSLYKRALDLMSAQGLTQDWRYQYLLESKDRPEDCLRRLSWLTSVDVERDLAK